MLQIRKNILVVFSLITITAICLAQDPKIDSLVNVLKKQNDDTNRVNTLNILGQQFLPAIKPAEAKKYAGEALLLARKISFKKGEALSHYNFGMIYLREYNFTEALQSFKTYLKLAEEMNNKANIIMAHQKLGSVYWNQWNYRDAYLNLNAALNISAEIGDYKGIAMSYLMLGGLYYDEGNYPEAIKQLLSSLTMYTKNNDNLGIAHCNSSIGEIYQTQKKYEEALKHLETALKIYEQTKDKYRVALIVIHIGEIYTIQGNYSKAFDKFKLSLNISREIKNKGLIALAHLFLGNLNYTLAENEPNVQEKEKLLQEALKFTQEGLNDFNIINNKWSIAKSYILIGLINIELKKFTDAKIVLNEALVLSKETGIKELIRDNYKALTKLDSLARNWQEAFRNNNLYLSYRDSLLNQENTEKILRLQMQYEFDKKEDSLTYQQVLTGEKLKRQVLLATQQKQSLLLKENEVMLLNNEKQLQRLQLESNETELAVQKAKAEKKQNQVLLLNQEKDIQSLQIKKQKQFRNYLLIGFALLIAVASFGYYSYRTRQKLKLQMLRNKIASDLHDDIGSTLSSISIFSQMAQQQSKETIPLLETIGDNSRKMLDAMADIVWTINPENDQFEKIVLRMRNFAYELLGAKNIDFEFNADEEVTKMKLSMEVRKNLYLIFKEATNNLVKYSGANKATFNIKAEKNNLSMMISDNGSGFDQRQTTAGNGLKNMKKRAEEIGAQFMIHSNPGNGTIIDLKVAV